MAERAITTRPRSHGHDFIDWLQKHWSKKGTASYRVLFYDTFTGEYYSAEKITTDTIKHLTVIDLQRAYPYGEKPTQ